MPRQPRIHVPGGLYHAVLRGNYRNLIFDGSGDYLGFMSAAPTLNGREELSTAARADQPDRAGRERASTAATCDDSAATPSLSLEAIAAEVAGARALTAEDLRSSRRRPELAQARREFTRRVLLEAAANLSQIARYLNRAPSTLSCLLYDRRKRDAAKS